MSRSVSSTDRRKWNSVNQSESRMIPWQDYRIRRSVYEENVKEGRGFVGLRALAVQSRAVVYIDQLTPWVAA